MICSQLLSSWAAFMPHWPYCCHLCNLAVENNQQRTQSLCASRAFQERGGRKEPAFILQEKEGFQRKTFVWLKWVMGAACQKCPSPAPSGNGNWRHQHLAGLYSTTAAGRYFSKREHSSIIHTHLILFAAVPIQTWLIRSSYFLACALKLDK